VGKTEDTDSSDPSEGTVQDPTASETVVSRTIAEDPLFRFLFAWRWSIIVVAIAFLGALYIRDTARSSHEEGMKRAADIYFDLREEFGEFEQIQGRLVRAQREGADTKKEEEEISKEDREKQLAVIEGELELSKRKLVGKIEALSDQKYPYSQIAVVYEGLLTVQNGDFTAADGYLEKFNWSEISDTGSSERFFTELGAMLLGRALLDNEETYQKGVDTLRALGVGGQFVHIAASLTLSKIASSVEEKNEALALLENILNNQPEQISLLEGEIKRLKS